ncbi:MAG TPA: hypothetical protein VEC19_06640 [Usitatibacter sp.]|nr:hypothetical protein [Usitatibacter sp.]
MKARNLFWSVRRETWENRSLYIAPIAIAGLALFGFVLHLGRGVANAGVLPVPFGMAASMVLVTGWVVGLFYALDALHGERRDRSILFWKSMPVSDAEAVIAKLAVALVVIPAIAMAVALAMQLLMLVASSAIFAAKGAGATAPLAGVPLPKMSLVMIYGVVAHSFWFAPIYAWLLLVSGWARRAPFLWAFLPVFALFALEAIAFGSRHVLDFLKYRLVGAMGHAFAPGALERPITEISQLTPGTLLGTPGFWLGLVFAALCIAAAIRLRRYRDPI